MKSLCVSRAGWPSTRTEQGSTVSKHSGITVRRLQSVCRAGIAVVATLFFVDYSLAAEPALRDPYAGKKKVLVVADLHTGNQLAHDAVSHAIATLERLGRDSGAYIAFLRTDTVLVTKSEVWGTGDYAKGGARPGRGRNLDYFDAVVFYTNGETEMTPQQKADLLTFVHEDGKGFVGVHTATASFFSWPEYGEMIGAYFDNHPWGVFDAPVVVERPDFPAMKHLPHEFTIRDEMYQYRAPYSREKVDVLASMDTSKLDLTNPNVKRADRDFPIAWVKSYGKGRVFSSTLGHTDESWDDPRVQTLYLEGIKWVLRLTDGNVQPHRRPVPPPHSAAVPDVSLFPTYEVNLEAERRPGVVEAAIDSEWREPRVDRHGPVIARGPLYPQ